MSDPEEDGAEYSVERILRARVKAGRKGKISWEYLVRWTGYESDDDSWQSPDSFSTKELIDDFWRLLGMRGQDIHDANKFKKGEERIAPQVGPPRAKKPKGNPPPLSKPPQAPPSSPPPSIPASSPRKRKRPTTLSQELESSPEVEIVPAGALSTRRTHGPSPTTVVRHSRSSSKRSRKSSRKVRLPSDEPEDVENGSSVVESTRPALNRISRGHVQSPPISRTASGTSTKSRTSKVVPSESASPTPPPSSTVRVSKRRKLSLNADAGPSRPRRHASISEVAATDEEPTIADGPDVWQDSIEEYPVEHVPMEVEMPLTRQSAVSSRKPLQNVRRTVREDQSSGGPRVKEYADTAVQTTSCSCDRCVEPGQTPASPETEFMATGLLSAMPMITEPQRESPSRSNSPPTTAPIPRTTTNSANKANVGLQPTHERRAVASSSKFLSDGSKSMQGARELNWKQLRLDLNVPSSWNEEDAVFEELKRRQFKDRLPTIDEELEIRQLIDGYRWTNYEDEIEDTDEGPINPILDDKAPASAIAEPASPIADEGLFTSPPPGARLIAQATSSSSLTEPAQGNQAGIPSDLLPGKPKIPAHRMRATNPQMKMMNVPNLDPGHVTGIATKARLANTDAMSPAHAESTSTSAHRLVNVSPARPAGRAAGVMVSTSPNGTPHRQFVTASRAGPGRNSMGMKPKQKSSVLTFTRDGAKTVRGSYPAFERSAEDVNRSTHDVPLFSGEEAMEVDGLTSGDDLPGARVSEPDRDVPPTAEELLARAGLNRDEANQLPDFEDDDVGHEAHVETIKPTDSATQTLQASAQTQDATKKPTVFGQAVPASLAAKPPQPSLTNAVRSSIYSNNSIFGPLGLGTISRTGTPTPPPGDHFPRASLSEPSFTIKLSEAAHIPVKLKNISSFGPTNGTSTLAEAVSARGRGPPGKYYNESLVVEVLQTMRTAGQCARVFYNEEGERRNMKEHWDRLVRRLESGDILLLMAGQNLLVFCASENVTVGQALNIRESLLGLPQSVVVSRVIIKDVRGYANVVMRAG